MPSVVKSATADLEIIAVPPKIVTVPVVALSVKSLALIPAPIVVQYNVVLSGTPVVETENVAVYCPSPDA